MRLKKTEVIFAAVNFMCVKLFLTAPQCYVDIGKNAAWIAVIINAVTAFLSFLLVYFLYVKSGKLDFFAVMPPLFKMTVGLLITAYFVITSGVSMAVLIRGVIRTFMPETPTFLLSAIFAAVMIYAASKGIKANIRLSMIITPLLGLLVLVSLSLIPHMEITRLFPLLGDNNFYFTSMFGYNFFSDFIVFYLMIPYMKNKKEVFSTGALIIVFSALLTLMAVVSDVLTIPYTAKFISPFYQIMTFMAGSNSIISIIKIFKLLFLINFFLYLSSSAAFAAHTLEKTFDLKYPEKTVWTVALLTVAISQIQYKTMTLSEVYGRIFSWTFVIFPLIPTVAYLFGRRKTK